MIISFILASGISPGAPFIRFMLLWGRVNAVIRQGKGADCILKGGLRMTINILGTEYTIEEKTRAEDDTLEACDGYCDKTTKEIVIAKPDKGSDLKDFDVYRRKVMRHEIVHAFLFESGLHENWEKEAGHDETMVDWIAVQFPKMQAVFIKAGCAM